MEELKKLAEFKFSMDDVFPKNPDDQVSEVIKTKIKNYIEKFNNIIISLSTNDLDIENLRYYRRSNFKARALHKLAKYYKISVPDIIERSDIGEKQKNLEILIYGSK